MKPIIEYRRVSESNHTGEFASLLKQQASNRLFAEQNGYEIVEVIEETASGNLGIYNREGLMLAIDRAGKLQCPVLVSSLDRIGRYTMDVVRVLSSGVEIKSSRPLGAYEKTLLGING